MNEQFYRAFEDLHRGTRALIQQRLRVYAPFVEPLAAAMTPARALDLGCGRGEWLELLGELGFSATGVDLDDGMLAACRERGLDVRTADALAALRETADNSLALVSSFHLVEHLPFDLVRELIAEALRVLRPGGLLIMETPNPENLVVGSSSFYLDPSHVKPLPPKLLAFATDFAGFARHKIVRVQEAPQLHEPGAVTLFGVLDGVSADYSVVAQKAGPAPLPGEAGFAVDFGLDLHTLAQRYDQQRLAAQDHVTARLAALESQQHDANAINVQRVESINEGMRYLNGRLGELEAGRGGSATGAAPAATDAGLERRLAQLERILAALDSGARTFPSTGMQERMNHPDLRLEPGALLTELQQAKDRLADMEATVAALRDSAAQAEARAAAAGEQLAQVGVWARAMEQQLLAIHNSTSWRLSRPLRMAGSLVRGRTLRLAVKSVLRRAVAWLASTQWARRLIAPLRRRFPAFDARLLRTTAALRRSDPDLASGQAIMPESAEELADPLPLSARQVLADLQRSLSIK